MKKLIYLFLITFLLTSCYSNNYVFTSIQNPFLDSTQVGSVKLLTSLDSKQLQTALRLHKEWIAGADFFYNLNYLSKSESPYSRIALDLMVSKNFYPFNFSQNRIGFSTGLGVGFGNTNYKDVQIPFDYNSRSALSDYQKLFLQLGLSFQRRKIHLNVFYRINLLHYNYYYNYYQPETPRKTLSNDKPQAEVYEFDNKYTLVNEGMFQIILRPHRRTSYSAELGVSNPTNLFDINDYRRNEIKYNNNNQVEKYGGSPHPNYVPVSFRLGVQFKLGGKKD